MDDKGIIKALRCFAEPKDFTLDYCRGCIVDGEPLCCENASDGIAKAALGLIEKQQKEIEKLSKDKTDIDNFARDICKKRMLNGKKISDFEDLRAYIEQENIKVIKEFVTAIEKRLEHNWDTSWEVFYSVMGSIHELAASRGVECYCKKEGAGNG